MKAMYKQALESLQKGQRVRNTMMLQLSHEGLIEVNPIKNLTSRTATICSTENRFLFTANPRY